MLRRLVARTLMSVLVTALAVTLAASPAHADARSVTASQLLTWLSTQWSPVLKAGTAPGTALTLTSRQTGTALYPGTARGVLNADRSLSMRTFSGGTAGLQVRCTTGGKRCWAKYPQTRWRTASPSFAMEIAVREILGGDIIEWLKADPRGSFSTDSTTGRFDFTNPSGRLQGTYTFTPTRVTLTWTKTAPASLGSTVTTGRAAVTVTRPVRVTAP